MDIFNKKKIAELEDKLYAMTRKRNDLFRMNQKLNDDLTDALTKLEGALAAKESIPCDCTPGSYCGACEFAKPIDFYCRSRSYSYPSVEHYGYICTKGESCSNFVQKKKGIKND